MYGEKVMEYFNNPRNMGEINKPDAVGTSTSATCGDVTKVYLKIRKDIVKDIKFKTFGCAVAVASGSVATELVKGKTLDEASKITSQDISEHLGMLPETKIHCAVLAEQAIINAIETYKKNKVGICK